MPVMTVFRWFVLLCMVAPSLAIAASSDPLFFRVYLTDGTSVTTYGELTRVGTRVVFSLVTGGGAEPRVQVATLPASAVDWERTDRHAASTRYQWYAATRGEEDFERLSDSVADVLNQVVRTSDRAKALEMARQARATLAEWPRQHFGYRQGDLREILAFLDEVITDLRATTGTRAFELALVATVPDVLLEPLATMPTPRDQVDQVVRLAGLTERPAERVALLHTALEVLDEAGPAITRREAVPLRRLAETRLRVERDIDARYTKLARRLVADATRSAEEARIEGVQRVLDRIPREDARLGGQRPETVQALRSSIQGQLDAAQRLRLLRDRWVIRRAAYRDYQRAVAAELSELAKARRALEAIRRLDGPSPDALLKLSARLRGGADRLDRVRPDGDPRTTHDLLMGAWRFAENAVSERYAAARAGDVASAWQASSAASGALLLLSRVQQEIRESIEPPQPQ